MTRSSLAAEGADVVSMSVGEFLREGVLRERRRRRRRRGRGAAPLSM